MTLFKTPAWLWFLSLLAKAMAAPSMDWRVPFPAGPQDPVTGFYTGQAYIRTAMQMDNGDFILNGKLDTDAMGIPNTNGRPIPQSAPPPRALQSLKE